MCKYGLRRAFYAAAIRQGQDFLEATPYWNQSTVPINTYKTKEPFIGKVISVKRIVGQTVRLSCSGDHQYLYKY
jgi:hypothetical protein